MDEIFNIEVVVLTDIVPKGYFYGVTDRVTGKGYMLMNSQSYREDELKNIAVSADQELANRLLIQFLDELIDVEEGDAADIDLIE